MSELVHVQLGGPMAKHFGRHWHLKVRNTKQALDLIEANKPGFKAWMKRNIKTYDRYHIQITNKQGHKWSVDESEYQMMGQSDNTLPLFREEAVDLLLGGFRRLLEQC